MGRLEKVGRCEVRIPNQKQTKRLDWENCFKWIIFLKRLEQKVSQLSLSAFFIGMKISVTLSIEHHFLLT